jgi:hypothetical protein
MTFALLFRENSKHCLWRDSWNGTYTIRRASYSLRQSSGHSSGQTHRSSIAGIAFLEATRPA